MIHQPLERPDPESELDCPENDEEHKDEIPSRDPGLFRPRQDPKGDRGAAEIEEEKKTSDKNKGGSKDHSRLCDGLGLGLEQMEDGAHSGGPSPYPGKKEVGDDLPSKNKTTPGYLLHQSSPQRTAYAPSPSPLPRWGEGWGEGTSDFSDQRMGIRCSLCAWRSALCVFLNSPAN